MREAVTELAKALAIAPDDPEVLFRASVVHAASGDSRQGLATLEKALANGYSVAFIENTDDLDALKGYPEFRSLLESARKRDLSRSHPE
jgi:hypothetical protein